MYMHVVIQSGNKLHEVHYVGHQCVTGTFYQHSFGNNKAGSIMLA